MAFECARGSTIRKGRPRKVCWKRRFLSTVTNASMVRQLIQDRPVAEIRRPEVRLDGCHLVPGNAPGEAFGNAGIQQDAHGGRLTRRA